MKNRLELIIALMTLLAMTAGGFWFVEDRVEAKTKFVKEEVKEDVDELKKDSKEKNEKQDEELDTLKEYSIKQSVIMENIVDKLGEISKELKK
jgi:uncharacterized protein YxeA